MDASTFVGNHDGIKTGYTEDVRLAALLLPLGRIHGPRDRISQIDPTRLYEQYSIVWAFIQRLEEEAVH
jgi:hypothetical protein